MTLDLAGDVSSNSSRVSFFRSPPMRGFLPVRFLAMRPSTPVRVEGPDDFLHLAFTKIGGTHDLVTRTAGQEHGNDDTATIGFLIASLHGRLEIGKRRILRLGSEISPSYDS